MASSSSAADHHHHHHRRRRDVPPDNQRHRDPSAGDSNHSHHGHGHGNGSGGMSGSEHSRRSRDGIGGSEHGRRSSNRNRSDRGHATTKSSSSSSSPTAIAFRECLASLNLPPGLLSSILTNHRSCDSRLWLLDNSSLMKVRDSHVGRRLNKFGAGSNNEIVEKVDDVSRWEELRDAVEFHAGMAARCRMPTRYWLVNPDEGAEAAGARNGYKFGVCWGSSSEDDPNDGDGNGDDDNAAAATAADDETRNVRRIMDNVTLSHRSACPLASRVRSLAKGIARESPALHARDRRVAVVICTQGLPTDDAGATNSSVQKEFVHELAELSKLPAIRVIVRLCTDDGGVRDVFNTMDGRFDSFDVLDDFWGEAMEVYLHNPWLTYGMGLHRLREAGLAPEVLDDIDERPLTLDEIHRLCKMLFLGEDDGRRDAVDDRRRLPHPARHWNGFFKSLRNLVEKEKPQWNPIRKSTMPWINLQKLESIHIREHRGKHRGGGGGGGGGEQNRQQQQQQQRSSSHQHQHRRTSHQSHESREETKSQRSSQASHQSHHSGRHETRQHHHQPPHTDARQQQQQQQHHHEKRKPTSSDPTSSTTPPEDLTLTEVLEHWSHEPPRYESMRPLQDLLVTVPRTLFPPNNTEVEGHEYFAKWKVFDEEAFADESGDELKELLKRAVRKAKFFLHPDKLPKDLTEDQTLLFKTVWNVIAEQESETLG